MSQNPISLIHHDFPKTSSHFSLFLPIIFTPPTSFEISLYFSTFSTIFSLCHRVAIIQQSHQMQKISLQILRHVAVPLDTFRKSHPKFSHYLGMQMKVAPILAMTCGAYQYYCTRESNQDLSQHNVCYFVETLEKSLQDELLLQEETGSLKSRDHLKTCLQKLTHFAHNSQMSRSAMIDKGIPLLVAGILNRCSQPEASSHSASNYVIESLCVDLLYTLSGSAVHMNKSKQFSFWSGSSSCSTTQWTNEVVNSSFISLTALRCRLFEEYKTILASNPDIIQKIELQQQLPKTNESYRIKRCWRTLKQTEGILCSLATCTAVPDQKLISSLEQLNNHEDYECIKNIVGAISSKSGVGLGAYKSALGSQEFATVLQQHPEHQQLEHALHASNPASYHDAQAVTSLSQVPQALARNLDLFIICALTPFWIRQRYVHVFKGQILNKHVMMYQLIGCTQLLVHSRGNLSMSTPEDIAFACTFHSFCFLMARFVVLPTILLFLWMNWDQYLMRMKRSMTPVVNRIPMLNVV